MPDFLIPNDDTRDYWAIAAYVMTAFTVIFLLVVIALSNSVKTSSEIMKQASTAIQKIPSILTYLLNIPLIFRIPIFVTIMNVVVFIGGIFIFWPKELRNGLIGSIKDKFKKNDEE